MNERIIALLKENPLVADYRLNTVKTESYEMFFVHRDLETVRSTDTVSRKVTVFVEKTASWATPPSPYTHPTPMRIFAVRSPRPAKKQAWRATSPMLCPQTKR